MQHSIKKEKLGPMGDLMSEAVQSCVHCGFCLSACPTYKVKRQEMDTPRGRIILMKDVLEESLSLEKALPHIDGCLGCLACPCRNHLENYELGLSLKRFVACTSSHSFFKIAIFIF